MQGSIANEEVRLFWGIAGDGSVVISHDLEIFKAGCAKSFAPFQLVCAQFKKRADVYEGKTKFEPNLFKLKKFKQDQNEVDSNKFKFKFKIKN